MRYRILPKSGPDHTVSYPMGAALERLLAAPAGARAAIRADEDAAGHIRHAVAGEVVDDVPACSVAALLAGGHIAIADDDEPMLDPAIPSTPEPGETTGPLGPAVRPIARRQKKGGE